MTHLSEINSFLESKKLAIAGVSRNPKKFGFTVYKELLKKGFDVYPINPNTDLIEGKKCYRDVASLPDEIKHLHITTPKEQTLEVVKQAVDKGIRNIWIQQTADTSEAVEFALNNKVNLIYKKCILMFAEPVKSIHKFHGFIVKLFGKYPK